MFLHISAILLMGGLPWEGESVHAEPPQKADPYPSEGRPPKKADPPQKADPPPEYSQPGNTVNTRSVRILLESHTCFWDNFSLGNDFSLFYKQMHTRIIVAVFFQVTSLVQLMRWKVIWRSEIISETNTSNGTIFKRVGWQVVVVRIDIQWKFLQKK